MKRLALPLLAVVVLAIAFLGRFWTGPSLQKGKAPNSMPAADQAPPGPASDSPPEIKHPLSTGTLLIMVLDGETPVQGAQLTVIPENRSDRARDFTTRKDGTQEVLEIPEGNYLVLVRHPGFGPEERRANIHAAEKTELVVRLIKGAEIYGTVSDERGAPIEGTMVALLDSQKRVLVRQSLAVRTNSEGRYCLAGILPGEYIQNFGHPGYRLLSKEGIRIQEVADRLQIDVILQRGASVSGRIVSEESRPIAGAWVLAVGGQKESADTRSDPDGRFLLQGLGDGPLTVRAEAAGYGITFRNGVSPNSTDLEIRLPRAATISGRVEASPLPEAFAVRLWKYEANAGRELGLEYTARFNEKGEFTVPNLAPGPYRLEIESPGFETLDRPSFTLQSGLELSHVIIRMRRKP
jgi:hypothetical protein